MEQQRACIILGDLAELDRTQRCGDTCSEPNEGYTRACKLGTTTLDPTIRQVYATDVCGIATSAKRGASIADGIDTIRRIRDEARARVQGAKTAAEREGERLAAMAEMAAREAQKAEREAYEADARELAHALDTANWEAAYELVKKRDAKSPVDAHGAAALAQNWDSFLGWAIQQSSPTAVYFDISAGLGSPALSTQLGALRDRALLDLQARARQARGVGGQWLYAALIGKLTGDPNPAADLYAKLVAGTRVSLSIDRLSPSCAPLFPERLGKKVRATSTLVCTVVPEKKWTAQEPMVVKQRVVKGDHEEDVETQVVNNVEHRAFAVAVHGTLVIAGKAVPVDYEQIVDDRDEVSALTFDQARDAATAAIVNAAIVPLEAAEAAKAYAAAKQALTVERQAAAENSLVTHALLAGSSPELDQVLTQFGVTFSELLPH